MISTLRDLRQEFSRDLTMKRQPIITFIAVLALVAGCSYLSTTGAPETGSEVEQSTSAYIVQSDSLATAKQAVTAVGPAAENEVKRSSSA